MMKRVLIYNNGRKKGPWSKEEDNKLRAYIRRYGHWNWRLLPKYAGKKCLKFPLESIMFDDQPYIGLERCGKSCRLRWLNYLKPGLKRGNYTKEEEDLIIQLHGKLGNKWSAIAAKLPGRTDNDIKNFWHARLKKRNRTPSGKIVTRESESDEVLQKEEPLQISPPLMTKGKSLESSSLQESENPVASLCRSCSDSAEENFWTEPFQVDYFESSNELDYGKSTFFCTYIPSPPHWSEEDNVTSLHKVAEHMGNLWSKLQY